MYGKRLAMERDRLGLKQSALAQLLGISRSGLAMIETDHTTLDIPRLMVAAEKAGVDPVFILTGEAGKVAASKLMDWSLVLEIQTGVRAWCTENRISLSIEKETLVLKILYERFSQSPGEDMRAGLGETLRLAA